MTRLGSTKFMTTEEDKILADLKSHIQSAIELSAALVSTTHSAYEDYYMRNIMNALKELNNIKINLK